MEVHSDSNVNLKGYQYEVWIENENCTDYQS